MVTKVGNMSPILAMSNLESIAIDKVSASDEKVDPVDCVDKSYAGIEVCQLCHGVYVQV